MTSANKRLPVRVTGEFKYCKCSTQYSSLTPSDFTMLTNKKRVKKMGLPDFQLCHYWYAFHICYCPLVVMVHLLSLLHSMHTMNDSSLLYDAQFPVNFSIVPLRFGYIKPAQKNTQMELEINQNLREIS